MKGRLKIVPALALLCLVLCCVGASAQDWQGSYAQKIAALGTRQVAMLMKLSGNKAPDLVLIQVDAAGSARIRLYGAREGGAAPHQVPGYDPETFGVSRFVSSSHQLRVDAKGRPCLCIFVRGKAEYAVLALAGDGTGGIEKVFTARMKDGSYHVNGNKVNGARYRQLIREFNAAFRRKRGAVPAVRIPGGRSVDAARVKVDELSHRYARYSTVKRVRLNRTRAKLNTGATLKIRKRIAPATAVFDEAVWSSSNQEVAAVSEAGVVTALRAGNAVISCKLGEASASCHVKVSGEALKPTGVQLDLSKASMIRGERMKLNATVLPQGVDDRVKWTSSAPGVAFVDSDGSVRAERKGSAVITAKTMNGKTAACKVTVRDRDPVIVDISQHNASKEIDWEKVAESTDLLILRCGVTRTKTNPIGIGKDAKFAFFAKKCQAHGIPFGVYYYGKCSTVQQALEEAEFTWQIASPYDPLFYVYDAEESRLNKEKIEAYMKRLQALGAKKTGYYIAHNLYVAYRLDTSLVDFIWIPRYGKNDGTVSATPKYACDMHQYTSMGRVPGFPGRVDVNRLTGSKPFGWFTAR